MLEIDAEEGGWVLNTLWALNAYSFVSDTRFFINAKMIISTLLQWNDLPTLNRHGRKCVCYSNIIEVCK